MKITEGFTAGPRHSSDSSENFSQQYNKSNFTLFSPFSTPDPGISYCGRFTPSTGFSTGFCESVHNLRSSAAFVPIKNAYASKFAKHSLINQNTLINNKYYSSTKINIFTLFSLNALVSGIYPHIHIVDKCGNHCGNCQKHFTLKAQTLYTLAPL